MRRWRAAAAALAVAAFAAGLLPVLLDGGLAPPPPHQRPSAHVARSAAEETGALNLVAAVLLDYRAFDTLGEATVIFAAAAAVTVLLGGTMVRAPSPPLSPVVRCAMSYLLPFFWVFPVSVILQGHLTPGGGFQGGVALAVLLILAHVVYGIPESLPGLNLDRLGVVESVGALVFLVTGLVGLAVGAGYLANLTGGFPPGEPGALASGGMIPLLNVVIGFKVAAALAMMFHLLTRKRAASP